MLAAAGLGGQSLHLSFFSHRLAVVVVESCSLPLPLHLFLGLMVTVHDHICLGMFMSHMRASFINIELLGRAGTEDLHTAFLRAVGVQKRGGVVALCWVKNLGR